MVVRITSPHSLQRALNYNEQKCHKGKAVCIHAEGYLLSQEKMNFHNKLERLHDLQSRNERSKKSNTLHISLNFDPSEKLSREKLTIIAQSYMDKIGFGNQPYLVYEHHDAGHPHIHIVTTNIQADGKRIDTYNIGRNQSETARKEIELDFKLIRAGDKKQAQLINTSPVDIQKVQYGKSETIRSITNVLDHVINSYKYTSLAELNAILKQYNVIADRGRENSIVHRKGGLLYCLLDEKGNKTGVPVKASHLYSKPTLAVLEKKFQANETLRQPDKRKLKASIDWVLAKSPGSLKEFTDALLKERVQTVLRQNKQGLIYGITFIDFRTKSIFNGSDIGKQYSIAGIESRIGGNQKEKSIPEKSQISQDSVSNLRELKTQQENSPDDLSYDKGNLLQEIMDHEKNINRVAGELLKKKKKKRNKNL